MLVNCEVCGFYTALDEDEVKEKSAPCFRCGSVDWIEVN